MSGNCGKTVKHLTVSVIKRYGDTKACPLKYSKVPVQIKRFSPRYDFFDQIRVIFSGQYPAPAMI